jgi:D-sedoheptulose 7-phosphate isomerase
MKDSVKRIIEESRSTKETLLSRKMTDAMIRAARCITKALRKRHTVIIFGNGGSAADSQHMAAELVGRFKKERRAFSALALTTNTSLLTALSNDYGYGVSFARQLEGLGRKGDVAVGISTSGTAVNVIRAVKAARRKGLATIALTGKKGGALKRVADIALVVDSDKTPRIQEAHILIIHILCELIEEALCKK